MNNFLSKKNAIIFTIIAIINLTVQLINKPIKISNWVSAISFLLLSIYFWYNYYNKKN